MAKKKETIAEEVKETKTKKKKNTVKLTEDVPVAEVVTEVSEPDDLTQEEQEAIEEFTSPENIENLEKELNEAYNVNPKTEEEPQIEEDIDLGVAQEVMEEFDESKQRVNELSNSTDPSEMKTVLQGELNKVSDMREKLEKRIDELEQKISPQVRSTLNSRMTNLWCGVRYT